MSKPGQRGKSAQGAAGGAKWENALLSAVFEDVRHDLVDKIINLKVSQFCDICDMTLSCR